MLPFEFAESVAPVAVGCGRLTLDVIVHEGGPRQEARSQAGGTCGNVLADLAYLGWHSFPLTDLGDDEPGRRFQRDLARWGVRLDLIRSYADQETPVIVHQIRHTKAGAEHSFSSRCPFCDRRLRYYEPVPLPHVQERLAQVPQANAYFFDRDSPGSIFLARHCREQAALVVYEPNYAGPESDLEGALAPAHVLKFAHEKLPELTQRQLTGPWLIIETRGADGLRFCDLRTDQQEWVHLPALKVAVVRDAAGSGDWCTAGFLHRLGKRGAAGLRQARAEEIVDALRFGMALAAWNCAFEGARGGVYRVDRADFQRSIQRILAGEVFDPAELAGPSSQDEAGRFCPGCATQAGSR